VRGIVHAAGVLDDALLEQQDGERLARVLAPKVAGAWNLHQQSTRWPLDFFVLYSSAASLVGSPGQSNYAAANAFLDALARHRRTLGLPGLSIAWGAFSEVGLAASQQNRGGRLEGRGVRSLTPDEGLAAFERLLGCEVAQMGVVPLDVRQWIEFFPQLVSSSRFAHLLQNAAATTSAAAPFRQSLETAPPDKRLALLSEFLASQVGRVLGIDPKRLNHQTPLPAMGLDSLMGLELRNRMEAGLGMKLSAAMLWTYPTLAALAANLSLRLGLVQPGSPSAAAAQAGENKEDNDEVRQFARQLDELGEPELVETFDRYLQGLRTGGDDVNRVRAARTGGAR
jgi:aryl carrier-like protein